MRESEREAKQTRGSRGDFERKTIWRGGSAEDEDRKGEEEGECMRGD